ncbi:MAG: AMP-binding protein [Rhodocyclaceae bacterium]|nr:AMP-binding protein [Rhodocyclaceae bacterium]MBX3670144.1 AMP-binding protein [Rhodocyclaceae bacterium]
MADADDPASRCLAVVRELVAELHPAKSGRVAFDARLEHDLGLDSLARVELLLRLGSEFQVELPDGALLEAQTPHDLLRLLAAARPQFARALELAAPLTVAATAGRPDAATTLVEVLEWHAARHPERTHVLFYEDAGAQAYSYADLLQQARAVASGLVARGLAPQQTVALMLPTGAEYLASFFGVLLAGAVPVPIYPPVRASQIEEHLRRHARILDNAGCAMLITVREAKAVAGLLRAQVATLREVLTVRDLEGSTVDILYRGRPADLAFLQYTSGSTGDPKGVMLTHANLLANIRAIVSAAAVSSSDVCISWLPLYHDMGLIGAWLCSLYCGVPLVLMSPLAFLARPARWLQAMHQYRGTITAAPNFAYEMIASKLPDADLAGLDLSSMRLALNGAEPVQPATLARFLERLAPCGFAPGALAPVYGLAECSVGLALPPLGRGAQVERIDRQRFANERLAVPAEPGAADALQMVGCGLALPGHEIRIVNEAGRALPPRHVGRVQFRGPSATAGYFRNDAATSALLREEGWLDSGDYGYLAEGEIYLTGRAKDLIIKGGRNLYPYDLEAAVGAIPGVRRGCVAVFAAAPRGVPERLVVLAETVESDAAARARLSEAIAQCALDVLGEPADEIVLAPRGAVFKTSSGKIRRSECRAAYEGGRIAVAPTPAWKRWLGLARALLGEGITQALQEARARAWGIWAWTVFLLFALPAALLVGYAPDAQTARRRLRRVARCARCVSGIGLSVQGLSLLPGRAHLLVVNHASYLDAVLLTAILPPNYRVLAKRELAGARVLGRLLSKLDTLFVERSDAERGLADLLRMEQGLQAGDSVLVFPEGTFSAESGLRPLRMGAFAAAARVQAPIAVAGLRGTRAMLRDGTWWPRPGQIEFELGGTFVPTGEDWSAAVRLRDSVRAELLRLAREPDLGR